MLACHLRNISDDPEVPGFFPKVHQGNRRKIFPLATQDKGLEARGGIHNLSADNKDLG